MPGLPVLVAAIVAIVVGWFNWWERRPRATDAEGVR
jgi:uncharacterized iron-regulated membrane protein